MRQDLSVNELVLEQRAGSSRLLSRLYRDIGVAAVVAELELQPDELEPEIVEAVGRAISALAPNRAILAA